MVSSQIFRELDALGRLGLIGFRIQVRIQGSGHRVQDTGLRIQVSGHRVQDTGFRMQGSGYRVSRYR